MSKALMAVMALAIGLTFGMATFAKADEKAPATATEKKDTKKTESAGDKKDAAKKSDKK